MTANISERLVPGYFPRDINFLLQTQTKKLKNPITMGKYLLVELNSKHIILRLTNI